MIKQYKIFFDDIRTVDMVYDYAIDFEVIRNVKDFKKIIEERGIPEYISFDHDLGVNSNGEFENAYDVVKWMIYEKEYDLREMDFIIHSDNLVGSKNIITLIRNWNKELNKRDIKST